MLAQADARGRAGGRVPGCGGGRSSPAPPAPPAARSAQTLPRPPASATATCRRTRKAASIGVQRGQRGYLVSGVGRQLVGVEGEPVRAHYVARLGVVEYKARRNCWLYVCGLLYRHAQPYAALPLRPPHLQCTRFKTCTVASRSIVLESQHNCSRASSECSKHCANSPFDAGSRAASMSTPS